MGVTKNGVCYDLRTSPYTVEKLGYSFAFSTAAHADRFRQDANSRIAWLADSFTRRFKYRVDVPLLAVFQLYAQVETRGFYVVDSDGREFLCRDEVGFGGLSVRSNALEEPSTRTTQPLIG